MTPFSLCRLPSLFGRALFPFASHSHGAPFRSAPFRKCNRPKLDIRVNRKARMYAVFFLPSSTYSESSAERPSSFFVLSGCAGRPRNEGREGRSGIACKSYASSSIYPPSNPIRLTRDIVRAVRVYREPLSDTSRRFTDVIPERSCPSSENNFPV